MGFKNLPTDKMSALLLNARHVAVQYNYSKSELAIK